MSKKCYAIFAIFIIFNVIGCSGMYKLRSASHNIVAIEQPQELNAIIIEGKTTKQEIIDALGMPKSMDTRYFSYSFRKGKEKVCKLQLTQKDGTILNVILGPDSDYDNLSVSFDDDLSIVNFIHVF